MSAAPPGPGGCPRDGPRRPRKEGVDRGSATILAVGVVGGLATVLVAALALVSALVAGQQARAAADLAALAGAGQVVLGAEAQACATARTVAERNGARAEACELRPHGTDPWPRVLVTVSRDVSGTPWAATARAAAGGAAAGAPSP